MKEQLISFKTAKLAKEKGFNWPTLYAYGAENELSDMDGEYFEERGFNSLKEYEYWNVSAPTQSLLHKWLRENYKVNIIVVSYNNDEGWLFNHKGLITMGNLAEVINQGVFNSYEEALEKGLQEALKLIP